MRVKPIAYCRDDNIEPQSPEIGVTNASASARTAAMGGIVK
jgi:hypothetical protein